MVWLSAAGTDARARDAVGSGEAFGDPPPLAHIVDQGRRLLQRHAAEEPLWILSAPTAGALLHQLECRKREDDRVVLCQLLIDFQGDAGVELSTIQEAFRT